MWDKWNKLFTKIFTSLFLQLFDNEVQSKGWGSYAISLEYYQIEFHICIQYSVCNQFELDIHNNFGFQIDCPTLWWGCK